MTIRELLDEIGIEKEYTETDYGYKVSVDDSNDFARIYTILDRYTDENMVESSIIGMDKTVLVYRIDKYYFKLYGDFIRNEYKLTIGKVEE